LKDTDSIDVQGFFDNNNNFILKEIGIVFEKDPYLNKSFLIEPPHDFTLLNTKFRKTAIWLANTQHLIFWNDGENSFPQTSKYLRTITSGNQIICKGVEKNDFYRSFLGVVSSLISRKRAARHLKGLRETGFPIVKHTLRARFVLLTMHT